LDKRARLIISSVSIFIVMLIILELYTVPIRESRPLLFSLSGTNSIVSIPVKAPNDTGLTVHVTLTLSQDSDSPVLLTVYINGKLVSNTTLKVGESREFNLEMPPGSQANIAVMALGPNALGSLLVETGYNVPAAYTFYSSLLAPVGIVSGVLVGLSLCATPKSRETSDSQSSREAASPPILSETA
jgi:hypothetical protein